ARAAEVEPAVAHPHPFAALKEGRARRGAARAQVIVWRFDDVEIDPANLTPAAWRDRDTLPVAAVGQAADREGLQLAAFGQPPRRARQETVEQAVVLVLGHVDRAGARIDAGRLVTEAPHRLERPGIDEARGGSGHFEDVPVFGGPSHHEPGLLASQPAAPRRDAAGAAAHRPGERAELPRDPQ